MPPLHQKAVEFCGQELHALRLKLLRVIGKEFTIDSSQPYEERAFSTFTGYDLDKRKVQLVKMMQVPKVIVIKVGTLVDRCLKSLVPGSAQYDDLVNYADRKENEQKQSR